MIRSILTKIPKSRFTCKRIVARNTRSFFTFVRQGCEAQRTWLGKEPTTLQPGLHFFVPILHRISHVDMREGSIPIHDLKAYTKDNVPVYVTGTLFYQITNSYKSCFEAQDVAEQVSQIGTSAARGIVGTMVYDEIIADRNTINKSLTDKIDTTCEKWGVDCTKFEIQDFNPQNREVEIQLERQMKEERERRAQVLNTEANVNVADGEKRAAILHSEGELESSKNKAEGRFILEQRKADAERYAKEQEAIALAEQIRVISTSIGDETLSSRYLLEQRKLDHLSALANGNNNSTYFLPESDKLFTTAYSMVKSLQ